MRLASRVSSLLSRETNRCGAPRPQATVPPDETSASLLSDWRFYRRVPAAAPELAPRSQAELMARRTPAPGSPNRLPARRSTLWRARARRGAARGELTCLPRHRRYRAGGAPGGVPAAGGRAEQDAAAAGGGAERAGGGKRGAAPSAPASRLPLPRSRRLPLARRHACLDTPPLCALQIAQKAALDRRQLTARRAPFPEPLSVAIAILSSARL